MRTPWAGIQEPLVDFFGKMVDKSDDVRREAREVADLYGRYHPDKFRDVWWKLSSGGK
jgi:hypothetical protein